MWRLFCEIGLVVFAIFIVGYLITNSIVLIIKKYFEIKLGYQLNKERICDEQRQKKRAIEEKDARKHKEQECQVNRKGVES